MTQKKRKPTGKPGAAGGAGNQSSAQRRLAAQRAMAAASGAKAARRNRLLKVVVAPIVAVLVVVGVIVGVGVSGGGGSGSAGHAPVAAAATVTSTITTIPASVFDTVGVGTGVTAPAKGTGTTLTADGLPRVLYVGAEWCPYCAAERWAITAALARFGTFTGLQTTYSKSDDVDPNTPTLSFASAKYTSTTISASLNEIEDYTGKTVLTLPTADSTLFTGSATGEGGGSFPYVNIGGKFAISGASYNPGLLKGKTYAEIAAAMADPSTSIAKAVDGTANYITAAICDATGQQPSAVCSSAGVVTAARGLGIASGA